MVVAVLLAGCSGQVYDPAAGAALPGAIPNRYTWRASGDFPKPVFAIDGDVNTVTSTVASYGNASMTIDLGKASIFNMVVMDHGVYEYGFPRRVAVLTSLDGKNFSYRFAGPGTRRVTILSLMTPTMARYVKLQAVEPGDKPWSIAELYFQ
jgi:hypothetical protein